MGDVKVDDIETRRLAKWSVSYKFEFRGGLITSFKSLLSRFLKEVPLSFTMRFSRYFLAFTFGMYLGVLGRFLYSAYGKTEIGLVIDDL